MLVYNIFIWLGIVLYIKRIHIGNIICRVGAYVVITLYIHIIRHTSGVCWITMVYSGFPERDVSTEIFLSRKLGNKNILGSTDRYEKALSPLSRDYLNSLYYNIMLNVSFGCVCRRQMYITM